MNKAKTLKRHLGNPRPFLSVAWDSNDIPSQVCVNPNIKWKDIDWKQVEIRVFKLQKLIYTDIIEVDHIVPRSVKIGLL